MAGRFWVGITDLGWYRFLASRPHLDEVNFWQPTAGRRTAALLPGEPFLFKLKSAHGGFVVGGGRFVTYGAYPAHLVWEAFGEKNGAATYDEMLTRIIGLRSGVDRRVPGMLGCNVLGDLFYLPRERWVQPPWDWKPNVQSGQWYDTGSVPGRALWDAVLEARGLEHHASVIAEERYGKARLVRPRLGQGGFRLLITDAYQRRCAITGERTLPALEAAHIKPYAQSGEHRLDNGLLLRRDLHALFDDGYVTVTADHRLRVSKRIREEYENGRDYYAMEGVALRLPVPPNPVPSPEYLEWHGDTVFKA
jgi:putative restriction endonuclease